MLTSVIKLKAYYPGTCLSSILSGKLRATMGRVRVIKLLSHFRLPIYPSSSMKGFLPFVIRRHRNALLYHLPVIWGRLRDRYRKRVFHTHHVPRGDERINGFAVYWLSVHFTQCASTTAWEAITLFGSNQWRKTGVHPYPQDPYIVFSRAQDDFAVLAGQRSDWTLWQYLRFHTISSGKEVEIFLDGTWQKKITGSSSLSLRAASIASLKKRSISVGNLSVSPADQKGFWNNSFESVAF